MHLWRECCIPRAALTIAAGAPKQPQMQLICRKRQQGDSCVHEAPHQAGQSPACEQVQVWRETEAHLMQAPRPNPVHPSPWTDQRHEPTRRESLRQDRHVPPPPPPRHRATDRDRPSVGCRPMTRSASGISFEARFVMLTPRPQSPPERQARQQELHVLQDRRIYPSKSRASALLLPRLCLCLREQEQHDASWTPASLLLLKLSIQRHPLHLPGQKQPRRLLLEFRSSLRLRWQQHRLGD